ncbi:hypothetical protein ETAA8_22430 [Anatilimnocola aggregata]|uniref:Uncharacterized protein n=1 Tax=Anatilimnocola aggregata TaxID=2528021 RepID=A0A517YAB1_9BACT|nr:hypothetical protein [Anatilimnocola aggregata]QDU27158.1 hypothetical protein ETAA8_22430 [Anatilimnocola aggregata]
MPNKHSTASVIVGILLLLHPILYVGSYFALVNPDPTGLPNWGMNTGSGHYRYGGAWSDRVFWPLERIDRMFFPGRWDSDGHFRFS